MNVNFSEEVYAVTKRVCDEMCIRHPEELSFMKPLTSIYPKRNIFSASKSSLSTSSYSTLDSPSRLGYNDTLSSAGTPTSEFRFDPSTMNRSTSTVSSNGSLNGASSPAVATRQRMKNYYQKANLNSTWLNSSISLYEQNVRENDTLVLKFKYLSFYDLNEKRDITRINYIYEQLKASVMCQELRCSEDEMLACSALAYLVQHLSHGNGIGYKANGNRSNGHYNETNNNNGKLNGNGYYSKPQNGDRNGNLSLNISSNDSCSSDHDIDSELSRLENSLDAKLNMNGGTKVNGTERNGKHTFSNKPCRLWDKLKISVNKSTSTISRMLSTDKLYVIVLEDTSLKAYKPPDYDDKLNVPINSPTFELNMRKCQVNGDVSISQSRYCLSIIDYSSNKVVDYTVKCRNEEHYANWFAACKQATMGHSISHPAYVTEVNNTLALLKSMHNTSGKRSEIDVDAANLEHVVPLKLLKRKSKDYVSKFSSTWMMISNAVMIVIHRSLTKSKDCCPTSKNFL